MSAMIDITTCPDNESACRASAREIAARIEESRAARGAAHVALAGGNTPRRAYELLVELGVDWSDVHLWWGDERCVEPDDPDSNHRMAEESLLAPLSARGTSPLPTEHRIAGELGAEEAARRYAQELRRLVPGGAGGVPALDLALLGLGEDGHTASLFPGHPEVEMRGDLCLPVHDSPKPPPDRVTLSLDMLLGSRHILLLATGEGKAQALAATLAGPDPRVPASLLAEGPLRVIADEAALAHSEA
jgi:6-phosphogluconolactonase